MVTNEFHKNTFVFYRGRINLGRWRCERRERNEDRRTSAGQWRLRLVDFQIRRRLETSKVLPTSPRYLLLTSPTVDPDISDDSFCVSGR